MKKICYIVFCVIILSCGIFSARAQCAAKGYREVSKVSVAAKKTESSGKKKSKITISEKERNQFFSKSAFVGNSVSLGLKYYFNSKGKGYLGSPVMLVMGCYSFANDKVTGSKYQISYKGKKYKAKDAIAAAKVKRVFISMGTNDLWKPAAQTYEDYVAYVKGIREKNPEVVIFIEGTTPMCSARNRKYLNNSAINELNRLMKAYCEKHKNMYYIDVGKGMKNSSGGLNSKYSSDGYVHLNMSGYKIWTDNVTAYVDNLLIQEKTATAAVKKAAKSKKKEDYENALALVEELESSTTKDNLKAKLKTIKGKLVDTQEEGEIENE